MKSFLSLSGCLCQMLWNSLQAFTSLWRTWGHSGPGLWPAKLNQFIPECKWMWATMWKVSELSALLSNYFNPSSAGVMREGQGRVIAGRPFSKCLCTVYFSHLIFLYYQINLCLALFISGRRPDSHRAQSVRHVGHEFDAGAEPNCHPGSRWPRSPH